MLYLTRQSGDGEMFEGDFADMYAEKYNICHRGTSDTVNHAQTRGEHLHRLEWNRVILFQILMMKYFNKDWQ